MLAGALQGVVSAGDEWEAGWGCSCLAEALVRGGPSRSVYKPLSALVSHSIPRPWAPGAADGVLVLAFRAKSLEVRSQYLLVSTSSQAPRACVPGCADQPRVHAFQQLWDCASKAHRRDIGVAVLSMDHSPTSSGQAHTSSCKVIAGSFASDEDRVLVASGRWRSSSDAHSALMRGSFPERRWYTWLLARPSLASVGKAQDHLRNPEVGRFLLELGF